MLALVLLAAAAAAEEPPAPLRCLAAHYAVTAVHGAGGWWAHLPDGTRIPYDDGREKTSEERLAHPDVEDAFRQRYRPGPIRPVTEVDFSPGRVRLDPVFKATYGKSAKEVDVVPLDFLGQRLLVHRKVAPVFRRLADELARARDEDPSLAPFLQHLGGTFHWRPIAGTNRPSAHSYGVSIDLNVALSTYWRWDKGRPVWKNRVPQRLVDLFESEGFVWGGRWWAYDTMHFEYRPELLDQSCYP